LTFATEKEKPASERFMLIRVGIRKEITGDLVHVGGGIYRYTYTKFPGEVYRSYPSDLSINTPSDTKLTKVLSYPPASNEYTLDESENEIFVEKSSGLYKFFTVEYLHFTGTTQKDAPRDPTTAETSVPWLALVSSYPSVTMSIADITAGVFSISDTEIELINEGNWIAEYTSGSSTLYRQEVKIWLCINDSSNSKLIFTGETASIAISNGKVKINVLDSFNKLQKKAQFQTINSKSVANVDYYYPSYTVSFRPQDDGKPFLRHLQKVGIHDFGLNVGTVSETSKFFNGIYGSGFQPFVGAFRRVYCGFLNANDASPTTLKTQSIGSVTSTSTSGLIRTFNVTSHSNLYYGQNVEWVESSVTYYAVIVEIVSSTQFRVFGTSPASTSSVFTARKAFALYLRSGNTTVNLIQNRDYTLSDSGGFIVASLSATFESNFSSIFTPDPFDPNKDNFAYYAVSNEDLNHANVLKKLVEASGMVANSASFSAAASALVVNTCFTIPFMGSGDIGTYTDYASKILESTGGYLTVNDSGEIEYKFFTALSPTITLEKKDYSDFSALVEYQDIYSTIEATNPHFNNSQLLYSSSGGDTSRTIKIDESSELIYRAGKTKYITHVLESMSGSIDRVSKLNSVRRAKYSFSVAASISDLKLGDQLRIYNDKLPNNQPYVDCMVVSKIISALSSSFEAIDLPNF
jgi:hypothetical protein